MKTLKNLVKTETLNIEELMVIKGAAAAEPPNCDSYKCKSNGCNGTSCNQSACGSCACKTSACGNGTCKSNGCSSYVTCSVTGGELYL